MPDPRHALLLTLLFLTGCALSPQTVEINPAPEVPAANLGKNSPVTVTVVDQREAEAFGTRGGVYKETALIRPANNVAAAILETVKSGLQKQGFNAYNPSATATRLEVRLKTLEYIPESGNVVNRVDTRAVVEAVARRENVTHRGTFTSKVEHDTPMTPGAERNQAMITDVLERSLERMLSDPKLLAFLAGEDNPQDTPAAVDDDAE